MSKYSEMKKAYDKLVEVRSSGIYSVSEKHLARTEFRAAALELFPRAGSRAEASALDLIDYYALMYSRRGKKKVK